MRERGGEFEWHSRAGAVVGVVCFLIEVTKAAVSGSWGCRFYTGQLMKATKWQIIIIIIVWRVCKRRKGKHVTNILLHTVTVCAVILKRVIDRETAGKQERRHFNFLSSMRVLLCYNNCVGVDFGVAGIVVAGGIDSAATATIIIIITQTNCKHAFILIAGHTKALSPMPTSTPAVHS